MLWSFCRQFVHSPAFKKNKLIIIIICQAHNNYSLSLRKALESLQIIFFVACF